MNKLNSSNSHRRYASATNIRMGICNNVQELLESESVAMKATYTVKLQAGYKTSYEIKLTSGNDSKHDFRTLLVYVSSESGNP